MDWLPDPRGIFMYACIDRSIGPSLQRFSHQHTAHLRMVLPYDTTELLVTRQFSRLTRHG